MPIDGNRFDLQEIEQSCFHKRAKSIIEDVRTVSLALQLAEAFDDIAGMQTIKTAHRNAVEMVNRSRCDGNLHRYSTIHCLFRRAGGSEDRKSTRLNSSHQI